LRRTTKIVFLEDQLSGFFLRTKNVKVFLLHQIWFTTNYKIYRFQVIKYHLNFALNQYSLNNNNMIVNHTPQIYPVVRSSSTKCISVEPSVHLPNQTFSRLSSNINKTSWNLMCMKRTNLNLISVNHLQINSEITLTSNIFISEDLNCFRHQFKQLFAAL